MTQTVITTEKVAVVVTDETTGATVVTTAGQTQTVTLTTEGPQGPPGLGSSSPTITSLNFDPTGSENASPSQLSWNAVEGTLNVGTPGVTYQVGQELSFRCKNISASSLPNGTAVMFAGADASTGYIEVLPMIANGTIPGYVFFGVTTEMIAVGAVGYVTTLGKVRGINTSTYPEDAILYCDPSSPGQFVTEEPDAPNLKLPVAAVIKAASDGTIFVRTETGQRLKDCHDVVISDADDGDVLTWVDAANRWEHKPPANATAPRSITIASPQAGDNFTLFRTSRLTTISGVVGLVSGGAVTYELRYAADRTTSGDMLTSIDTVTNTTTGDAATIQNPTIPTNQWVWLVITTVSGPVSEFSLSVAF
jgi:hypothetical protein